jgi:hypothetical protein
MAFSFSPKHQEDFPLDGLNPDQFLAISVDAITFQIEAGNRKIEEIINVLSGNQ